MPIKPIAPQELEKAKQNRHIIGLAAQQVMKDFAQFGIAVEFPENLDMAYEQLSRQLETHVYELLSNDAQRLYALLYRIDISDNMIHKRQNIRYDQALPQVLTDLILERELQKVLFRLYFKQNH